CGYGQTDRFALQGHAGTAGGRDTYLAGIRCANGGADSGDLVFRLNRLDSKVLVATQLVQHVAGRGYRIGAEYHVEAAQRGCSHQPPGCSRVATDIAIQTWLYSGWWNFVEVMRNLSCFSIGVPRLEG